VRGARHRRRGARSLAESSEKLSEARRVQVTLNRYKAVRHRHLLQTCVRHSFTKRLALTGLLGAELPGRLEKSERANYYELVYQKRQVSCDLFPSIAVSQRLQPSVVSQGNTRT
jgi:hypothetical protein